MGSNGGSKRIHVNKTGFWQKFLVEDQGFIRISPISARAGCDSTLIWWEQCKKKRQTACKPGSVPALRQGTTIPLGRALRRASRDLPGLRGENAPASPPRLAPDWPAGRPYSVLLPVGFALPPLLPGARCALAAPFRPCRRGTGVLALAVCFLWHYPWGRPRRPLAGTVFPWSPDFPPAVWLLSHRQRSSGRLAAGEMRVGGRGVKGGGGGELIPPSV